MKKICLFTILIILIPVLIIGIEDTNEIINKIKYGIFSNKSVRVKNSKTEEIISVPLEEYVVGVVAGEMPASFNNEALKAQAVASRTYVLKRMENNKKEYDVLNNTKNQVYLTEEQMKEKWKDGYDKNLDLIKKVVSQTKGEVLLYENDIIDALFFSTSNGYTENSSDVFSGDLPYLKSVESLWDKVESPVFSSTKEVSKQEFLFNLGFDKDNNIDITNINKTKTGRVIDMIVNGKKIKSSIIRDAFGLKSTSFITKITDDKVIFSVSGYGHGVGMSQYGANGMAKEGYTYDQILKYYYKDCEIKKIN